MSKEDPRASDVILDFINMVPEFSILTKSKTQKEVGFVIKKSNKTSVEALNNCF